MARNMKPRTLMGNSKKAVEVLFRVVDAGMAGEEFTLRIGKPFEVRCFCGVFRFWHGCAKYALCYAGLRCVMRSKICVMQSALCIR